MFSWPTSVGASSCPNSFVACASVSTIRLARAQFELRGIIREQVYHLARVIEGKDQDYLAFVPA